MSLYSISLVSCFVSVCHCGRYLQKSCVMLCILWIDRGMVMNVVLLVPLCTWQFVCLYADLYHILKSTPKLVQEMLNLMQQAWYMYQYQRPKGVCVVNGPWSAHVFSAPTSLLGCTTAPNSACQYSWLGAVTVYEDTHYMCTYVCCILQWDGRIFLGFYTFAFFLPPVVSTDMSCPSIDSFENVMRLSGMIVQALWDTEAVFMQLPHIEADVLRHFYTKRVSTELS